jgi:hypothetical protein
VSVESSPREFYTLVSEKFGERTAKCALVCVLLVPAGAAAGALLAIGAVLRAIYQNGVLPVASAIGVPSLPPGATTNALAGVAVALVFIGVPALLLYFRWRGWSRIVALAVDNIVAIKLSEVNQRLNRLEQTTTSLESVNATLADIHARLSVVEPITAGHIRDDGTPQSRALIKLLSAPQASPVALPESAFPATLNWTRQGNCSGITIENTTPDNIEADVVLKALDRWSERHLRYLPGDIDENRLPGKLLGGSRQVKPEPVLPVSYPFITHVVSKGLRIQLMTDGGVQSLSIRQPGKWRATLAVVMTEGTERDFYAPFEWTGKAGPTPDGEIRIAAMQPQHQSIPAE